MPWFFIKNFLWTNIRISNLQAKAEKTFDWHSSGQFIQSPHMNHTIYRVSFLMWKSPPSLPSLQTSFFPTFHSPLRPLWHSLPHGAAVAPHASAPSHRPWKALSHSKLKDCHCASFLDTVNLVRNIFIECIFPENCCCVHRNWFCYNYWFLIRKVFPIQDGIFLKVKENSRLVYKY